MEVLPLRRQFRELKNQRNQSFIMFDKHTKNINLCCNIFFEYVESALRNKIPEYGQAEIHDTKKGILYCPECIIKRMKN